MIRLTKHQVEKLKIGDRVIYKEKHGTLANMLFNAEVVEKHEHGLTLKCAANPSIDDSFEDAKNYFITSYSYLDAIAGDYSGYSLYKTDIPTIKSDNISSSI